MYSGLSKAEGRYGANWVAAVKATQGLVLQYGGRIVEALYGSSGGGQTLYGGVPWLPSVADPQDSVAPGVDTRPGAAPHSTVPPTLKLPEAAALMSKPAGDHSTLPWAVFAGLILAAVAGVAARLAVRAILRDNARSKRPDCPATG